MTQSPAPIPESIRANRPLGRYHRVLTDGAWVAIGQGVAAIAGLVGTRLITRVVPPTVYGFASLLIGAAILARSMFCSPILNAGIRFYPHLARSKEVWKLRALLVRSLTVRLCWLLPTVLIAVWLYAKHSGAAPVVMWCVGALLVLDVARSLEMALLSGARRQRPAAMVSAAEAIAKPVFILLAVWAFGASPQTFIGGSALSIVIGLALFHSLAVPEGRQVSGEISRGSMDATLLRDLHRFARPLVPLALLLWTTSLSDRYIIRGFSSNAASVGLYVAVYGLISQPFILTHAVISLTLRPIYFNAASHGNVAHARRTFFIWFGASALVCGAGVVLATLLRKQVVELFLAAQYRQTASLVPWIALGYLFYVLQQVLEQNLLAQNRTLAVLFAQTCGAVASIVVTVPLVKSYGLIGAAYACPGYFFIQGMVTAALITRKNRRAPNPSEVTASAEA